ncbi:MAG: two-component system sensor histidine kinase NtrB [Thermodesulfobacteriota bacterium]
MTARRSRQEHDLYRKIKWLIFFRALFAFVLLGSLLVAIAGPQTSLFLADESLVYLFAIATGLLLFSLVYALVLPRTARLNTFAYIQIFVDTFLVTLIIFVTGAFSSVFTFLYLAVIIYATMVVYRRGGMIVATLCALQYGIMIDLEYFNIIQPVGVVAGEMISGYSWQHVLFRLMITIAACYFVAFLSGFLSEQERSAKQELWAMEDQMKRVERLAAVGEMAAGLTHEIKNPLASLTGSIQMLRESIAYDPAHDKLMQIVLREADRLSTLVTEFLMFSRPQVGNVQDIRIDSVIEDVVSLFRKDPAFQNRIEIETSLGAKHYIRIDTEHFRQVIWNLLNNAAEAIDGSGKIGLSLSPAGRDDVKITVEDNGIGISPENIGSIFDPFFSTKVRGTGLGLSIVQQIVGLYGGLVHIQSEPGKGTTVTLKFKSISRPSD